MNTSSATSLYRTTYRPAPWPEKRLPVPRSRPSRGPSHCLVVTARQEGVGALWKGTVGNYYRMLIWQGSFYPVYEWACWAILHKPGI